MIPFTPTFDDCIRAVYERFRLYGVAYKELSFEDIVYIGSLVYSIINMRMVPVQPQFYIRRQVVAQSGGRLDDSVVVVLNVRRTSDGAIAKYCTPQEWLQLNTFENAGSGIVGGHSYEPVYTVWGRYYTGSPAALVGPPNRTTTGVALTPQMYHGGVAIYYIPYDSEMVVDLIAIPSLPNSGPLFESQLLKTVPSLFDIMVDGIIYFLLLSMQGIAAGNLDELASQVAEIWGNFVGGTGMISQMPFVPPLQNEPPQSQSVISNDSSRSVSSHDQATVAETPGVGEYR